MSSRSEAAYIGGICSLTRGGGINEVKLVFLVFCVVYHWTVDKNAFLDEGCHKFLSRRTLASIEELN